MMLDQFCLVQLVCSILDKTILGLEKVLENHKYFKSDKTHYMGSLSQIPRVIIGADSKTVQELGELWLKRKNKELAEHQIQFQILDQILIQLESFEEYAEECNQPEIAEIYKKSHKIIMEIYEQKEATVNDTGERDSMFEKIKKAMDDFNH